MIKYRFPMKKAVFLRLSGEKCFLYPGLGVCLYFRCNLDIV